MLGVVVAAYANEEMPHAASLCSSFYRAQRTLNAGRCYIGAATRRQIIPYLQSRLTRA